MAAGFMRVFVAVDIGDDVRAALGREIQALKKTHPKVKWVAPEHIHLTLAFLGEIPEERLSEINMAMDAVAEASTVFSCEVKGVGWFGSVRSPRVVWAGMKEEPALMELQAGVAAALRQLGFVPEDRAFHPHLTLGRVKSARDGEGLAALLSGRGEAVFGAMKVDRVLVMRSQLRPQGPEYSVLHEAALSSGQGAAGVVMAVSGFRRGSGIGRGRVRCAW